MENLADKRVAIIESEPEPGGAAVHTGTLPSKTLRETALYLSGYESRDLYGVAVTLDRKATLEHLMARKKAIAESESRRIRENLDAHGVQYFHGNASFEGDRRVLIDGPAGRFHLAGDPVPATAEHGRGLKIIDAVTDNLQLTGNERQGTVVHFEKKLEWLPEAAGQHLFSVDGHG